MTLPTHEAARQPILNIPPATKALLIANVAVHFQFGWPALIDPISYQFLHGSLAHLAINMLALLAFGAGVERRIGGARMFAFAMICGVASVLAHLAVYPSSLEPVIGASGAISGLFGAVLRFRLRGGARGLLPLVALWIVMDVVTGESGFGGDGVSIAWIAHIGGFVAGLLLFGPFDRRAAHSPERYGS